VLYKSFYLYDVEFDWCWVLRVLVFYLSWCEVTVVRFDVVLWARLEMVETSRIRQVMWFAMLESAKDRVIGVDTSGQQVSAHVWYGMACLLIRYAIGCVSCSVEWGWLLSLWTVFGHSVWTVWTTWCKRGHCVWEISTLQVVPFVRKPYQSMTYSYSKLL
jgi:hypothetical protein